MRSICLLAVALLGCDGLGVQGRPGTGLTDGCTAFEPGVGTLAEEAVARLNCYRVLMGVPPVVLDAALTRAAQAHANYMDATDQYGHSESIGGHPLFSGTEPLDRLDAQGFALDTNIEGVHEVVSFHNIGADPTLAVDLWMDTVFHREPLTTPEITAVGFGAAGIFSVMELVSPWESPGETRWAVYPAAGQGDARTVFDSDSETPDPMPSQGEVGMPITLTAIAPIWLGEDDPYGLSINPALSRLTGLDGSQRALAFLQPAQHPTLLRTVAAVPTTPLPPHSTWDVTLVFTLGGVGYEESWSFATGPE